MQLRLALGRQLPARALGKIQGNRRVTTVGNSHHTGYAFFCTFCSLSSISCGFFAADHRRDQPSQTRSNSKIEILLGYHFRRDRSPGLGLREGAEAEGQPWRDVGPCPKENADLVAGPVSATTEWQDGGPWVPVAAISPRDYYTE